MVAILLGSDLHLEFYNNFREYEETQLNIPDASEYDVVVLAGDISSGLNGITWAQHAFPSDKPIIYVPGNHEYYGKDYLVLSEAFRYYKFNSNIHVLNPGCVSIDGVNFIGATLWSSAELPGYSYAAASSIQQSISDFKVIKFGNIELFSVARMQTINKKERDYIERYLDDYNGVVGKKVVVTHFLPSMKCISERYKGDILNPYFANDMDILVDKSDVWLFGHTHDRIDVTTDNGVRMISNPHGYPGENKNVWEWKIINV